MFALLLRAGQYLWHLRIILYAEPFARTRYPPVESGRLDTIVRGAPTLCTCWSIP